MLQQQNPPLGGWGSVCLSTAYLAPVEYYKAIAQAETIYMEQCEYYEKQSYRTRCHIATANGVMPLSIPVEKSGKMLIRDIKISEHGDWQDQHWRSIESAYNSTPFFEYYKDDFLPFYEKKWTFLWDFNLEIQTKVLELLDLETCIQFTKTYNPQLDNTVLDLRNAIHPKKNPVEITKPYYQVFAQKHGFTPNLSIIDLLFNMGNEAQLVIQR